LTVDKIANLGDSLTRNAVLSSNEIRQLIGFKPLQDQNGDILQNKNMPADEATTIYPDSEEGSDVDSEGTEQSNTESEDTEQSNANFEEDQTDENQNDSEQVNYADIVREAFGIKRKSR